MSKKEVTRYTVFLDLTKARDRDFMGSESKRTVDGLKTATEAAGALISQLEGTVTVAVVQRQEQSDKVEDWKNSLAPSVKFQLLDSTTNDIEKAIPQGLKAVLEAVHEAISQYDESHMQWIVSFNGRFRERLDQYSRSQGWKRVPTLDYVHYQGQKAQIRFIAVNDLEKVRDNELLLRNTIRLKPKPIGKAAEVHAMSLTRRVESELESRYKFKLEPHARQAVVHKFDTWSHYGTGLDERHSLEKLVYNAIENSRNYLSRFIRIDPAKFKTIEATDHIVLQLCAAGVAVGNEGAAPVIISTPAMARAHRKITLIPNWKESLFDFLVQTSLNMEAAKTAGGLLEEEVSGLIWRSRKDYDQRQIARATLDRLTSKGIVFKVNETGRYQIAPYFDPKSRSTQSDQFPASTQL